MSQKILLLCTFLFVASFAFAQKLKIEGEVVDSAGNALEMANIIALSLADTSMLSYAFTDDKGKFKMGVTEESCILRVSYLGYEMKELVIRSTDSKKEFFEKISLTPMSTELAEATVVEDIPIMISGDTISYKTDAFTTGRERKLGDVLEQLPGFEVDDDGQVKVEGKSVDKVMVEGKDFFDGDTKLATKNIPANAIDKVQVLRNHNDVGPMQGLDNDDRIVLNIKLKEGKKNMFFGDVSAEAGLDERYLVHPNLFYYSPKTSVNFIGDLNNIGEPAFTFRDYFRFTGGFGSLNRRGGTNFSMQSAGMGLSLGGTNRATEIVSQFGAANVNYTPNKKLKIDAFFIGNNSKTNTASIMNREYLNVDTLNLSENLTSKGVQENSSGLGKVSLVYTPSHKVHIGYKVFGKITDSDENENQVSVFQNQPLSDVLITQTQQKPYELKQNLEAYYDINKKNLVSLELQYILDYQNPQFDLNTVRMPFPTLIPIQDSTAPFHVIQFKDFQTNQLESKMDYYKIFNNTNHINFTLGYTYTHQQLGSSITEIETDGTENNFTDLNLLNDADFKMSDLSAGIHYRWKLGKLQLDPGISFHQYYIEDNQVQGSYSSTASFVLPDMLVRYNLKKSESLQLDYKMKAEITDLNNRLLGMIISSYNSMFVGNQLIENATFHSFDFRYFNVNMFNFTNIFIGGNYSIKANDITQVTNFVVGNRVNSPVNIKGPNEVLTAYGRYDKRFGKYRANVGATISQATTNNFINDEPNKSKSFTQGYNLTFSTNYKKAPNVKLKYNILINSYSGSGASNTFLTQTPSIEVDAEFLKSFTFAADFSYNLYKNVESSNTSEYDFLNASLRYRKTPKSRWEFSLRGLNLLNTREIRQDAFSDFYVSTTAVEVLPRYVMLGAKFDL